MHESMAKAIAKGVLRTTRTNRECLIEYWKKNYPNGGRGKKATLELFEFFCDMHGEFLLNKKVNRRISSWHVDVLITHISNIPIELVQIGVVYPIFTRGFSTRKFQKTQLESFETDYTSYCSIHEHFLQRIIQRADWSAGSNSTIKEDISRCAVLLSGLVNAGNFNSHEKTKIYACLPNHVLVATYHKNHLVIVFNTILEKARFTEKQKAQFDKSYQLMKQPGSSLVFFTNHNDIPLGSDIDLDSYSGLTKFCDAVLSEKNLKSYADN